LEREYFTRRQLLGTGLRGFEDTHFVVLGKKKQEILGLGGLTEGKRGNSSRPGFGGEECF